MRRNKRRKKLQERTTFRNFEQSISPTQNDRRDSGYAELEGDCVRTQSSGSNWEAQALARRYNCTHAVPNYIRESVQGYENHRSDERSELRVVDKVKLDLTHEVWAVWQHQMALPYESMAYGTLTDTKADILQFSGIHIGPQKGSGAAVTEDPDKYPKWWMDNIFKKGLAPKMRIQIHSHVNMGVSPSGTDLTLYKTIMDQLATGTDKNAYYIFIIMNKDYDYYAYQWNLDGTKIPVELLIDGVPLDEWHEYLMDNISRDYGSPYRTTNWVSPKFTWQDEDEEENEQLSFIEDNDEPSDISLQEIFMLHDIIPSDMFGTPSNEDLRQLVIDYGGLGLENKELECKCSLTEIKYGNCRLRKTQIGDCIIREYE